MSDPTDEPHREIDVGAVPVREISHRMPDKPTMFTYTALGLDVRASNEPRTRFADRQTPTQLQEMLRAMRLLPAPQPSPAYSQPDPRFKGDAYDYLRPEDRLPSYDELPESGLVIAKIRLFHPFINLVYHVAAVTDYGGQLVVSGFQIGPMPGSSFGDSSIEELTGLHGLPLPIERDLDFEPRPLAEIMSETRASERSDSR